MPTMQSKPKKTERITLVMPPELKDLIAASAEANDRSLSAEVLARVKASLALEKPVKLAR